MQAKHEANDKIKCLYEDNQKGIFNFDYVLQRDGSQWTANQKNALIDTILNGYVIPAIWYIEEEDDDHDDRGNKKKTVVDGKQRLTTIFSYINDEWKLAKSFEQVYYKNRFYDVADKKFSELDVELQEIIKDYRMSFMSLRDCTEEQIEEQFMRLNNGTPFKSTQKLRVALGTQVAPKFDEKVLNHPFWDRCANSIAKSKTDAKLGVTLETLMLLTDYEADGCGSKEVTQFADYYRDNYKDSDLETVASILDLLDECYPIDKECVSYLKKINLPSLMVLTKMFQEMLAGKKLFNGKGLYKFDKDDFSNWLRVWTTEQYQGDYFENGRGAGTTRKKKLYARINCICNNFLHHANAKTREVIEAVMGEEFDWENGDYSCLNVNSGTLNIEGNTDVEVKQEVQIEQLEFVGLLRQKHDNKFGDDDNVQVDTRNGDEDNDDCS